MILQPGCRFVVAPHFHMPADWPRRLLLGAGAEGARGSVLPVPAWRAPTAEELALLVWNSAEPPPPERLEACVCLFQIPGHLRATWWNLLEQAAEELGNGRLPGFERFVEQVAEFLAFKGLPVPEGAQCDAVVRNPGQGSVHEGPPANWAEPRALEPWGGINLGDEQTSVVLINLLRRQLEAELQRQFPNQPTPEAMGELVGQFFRACSDYPMVRLLLRPGEGYRLPPGGLVLDGYSGDKHGPEVLLLISSA
jgi:hypothetical protein